MTHRKSDKVISAVDNANYDISAMEISEQKEICHDTARKWLKTFEQLDLFEKTRKVGNATFYDIKRQ